MAHFVDELNAHPTLVNRFGRLFENVVRSVGRANEVERLAAMTDEQLSELGLRRQEIAQYVFRDRLDV